MTTTFYPGVSQTKPMDKRQYTGSFCGTKEHMTALRDCKHMATQLPDSEDVKVLEL